MPPAFLFAQSIIGSLAGLIEITKEAFGGGGGATDGAPSGGNTRGGRSGGRGSSVPQV